MADTINLFHQTQAYAIRKGLGFTPAPLPVPRLSILYSEAPSEISHTIYDPVFCLVLSGEKRADFHGMPAIFAKGYGLVVSLDLPATSWITKASPDAPYLALAVELRMAVLRELARDLPNERDEDPVSALASAPVSAPLTDVMTRLVSLLDRPSDRDALAPLYMRELHYLLLTSPQGAMLRRMARADSDAGRIADIVAHLRAHLDRPMRVDDLARQAGMSATVFHQRFREITGTTPIQLLKQLRLLEAQRTLRAGQANVTQAALRVGYESPSQFSRDYSRMFGLTPRTERIGVVSG
ncbi:AraC family transcriptional regulator [Notoacmeibacter sp. MSK16QG-6]|uniref:AraC family transcriptional regulator n=1 Tax=Notoacmeibacter sp. MSK16QG-6 TaxID=2957982 RepID=UPI00209C7F15|nr:AraC family transcriptional regulator [Notoacmeibacter sp. MSK16QG-6]MCP1198757.1 AraC family transcriptional regulator [Notoacmeibacter sp. MSK16QG-6]